MKKIYKKLIVISMVLILCIPQCIFASSINLVDEDCEASITISERDIIKHLQSMTDEELKSIGYSNKEIIDLRNISDKTMLKKARMQTDTELKTRGLTDAQIDTIRNETNVSKAASETYGEVTYTIAKESYSYKSGVTTLKLKASWKWKVRPAACFTDIIACTTSNNEFTKTSATGKVYYRLGSAGNAKKTDSLTVKTENSGTGTYSKFTMIKNYTDSTHPRPTKIYAFDGYMTTTFKASKKISSVGVSAKYGHTMMTVSPNVSFSSTGASISFSPSAKVGTGAEAYLRLTL